MALEPGTTWRERAGRIILDPFNAHDELIMTPTDRRWLWKVESTLTVTATSDTQRQLARDLAAYLAETCEHHWRYHEACEEIPAHRQCMWCAAFEWTSDKTEGN